MYCPFLLKTMPCSRRRWLFQDKSRACWLRSPLVSASGCSMARQPSLPAAPAAKLPICRPCLPSTKWMLWPWKHHMPRLRLKEERLFAFPSHSPKDLICLKSGCISFPRQSSLATNDSHPVVQKSRDQTARQYAWTSCVKEMWWCTPTRHLPFSGPGQS